MKRLFAFVCLLVAFSASGVAQTTPLMGLNDPSHGTLNWDVQLNANWNALDSYLGPMLSCSAGLTGWSGTALSCASWSVPGTIGSTTPNTGAFTHINLGTGGLIISAQAKPGSPSIGQCVPDSANSDHMSCWNGSTWDVMGASSSGSVCSAHYFPSLPLSDQITAAATFATTITVGTNCLGAGSLVTIRAHGVWTTSTTTAPHLSISANAGGDAGICPSPANTTLAVSQTNGYWDVECNIQINTAGSSGTAVAWGQEHASEPNGTTNAVSLFFSSGSTGTMAYNTSVSEPVTIQETAVLVSGQTMNLTSFDVTVQQ